MILKIFQYNCFLILIGLYLSGCANLSASIPYSKVLSPEVKSIQHEYSLDVINTTQVASYEISSDASKRPFVQKEFTGFDNESGKSISIGGDIQAFDRFEVGLSLGGVMEARAKYQLLGETFSESQDGNQSLTIFTTISSLTNSKGGDQNGDLGAGGYDWYGYARSTNAAFGLSYGYRLKKDVLLYTGFSLGQIDVNGEVIHEESDDKSSPKVTYDIDHLRGHDRTVGAGVVFTNNDWNLDLNLNNTRIELDEVVKSEGYATIRLTYLFGSNSPSLKDDIDPAIPTTQSSLQPKEAWQLRDFVAIASSYVVGFGTGQAIQNRWSSSGSTFAIVDSASLAMMLYGLTSCLEEKCSYQNGTMLSAVILYGASRIWQLVDVIIDANSTVIKSNSSLYLLPTQDGALMNYSYRF